MPFPWRAAFAGVFVLALLLSGAALSQFHVRAGSEGLSMGFGRGDFNTAALREEFLRAAAEDSQKNQRQLMEEVRDEIARLQAGENSRAQKLEEILVKLDSRIDGRVERSEEQVRQDTAMMVAVLYQELARQWKHDMELVNLRLELAQLSESLNMRQTEKTLGTLLQYVNMNY
jgi:CRISPR/Cas system CSM-associated protein Csm2 small subunit